MRVEGGPRYFFWAARDDGMQMKALNEIWDGMYTKAPDREECSQFDGRLEDDDQHWTDEG